MPVRPRLGHNRYRLTEGEVIELIAGPGPHGSVFRDAEERALAADAWAELSPDVSRLSLMRIEQAVERRRRGWWPSTVSRVPVNRRPQ